MITAISNFNTKNTTPKLNYSSKNNYLSDVSNYNNSDDLFVKSTNKKQSNISFKGYMGADKYARSEEKDLLKYDPKLTLPKICELFDGAKGGDAKISAIGHMFNDFVEDSDNILNSFRAHLNIMHRYGVVGNSLVDASQKDAGSKMQFLGVAVQKGLDKPSSSTVLEPAFNLVEDYFDIVDQYFIKGVLRLQEGHSQSTKALGALMTLVVDDIPQFNKMAQGLVVGKQHIDEKYKELYDATLNTLKKLTDNSGSVTDVSMSKKGGLTISKRMTMLFTFGQGNFVEDMGLSAFSKINIDDISAAARTVPKLTAETLKNIVLKLK